MKGAVPQDVVKKRAEELERLNAELMEGYARRFIGRTLNVLVEYEKDSSTGKLCGYTGNYIKVVLENAEGGGNRIVPAEIISVKKNRITGRLAAGPKTKNQVDT
jgi:threonylcarbamoyladenosine tRNA methylthiotransferase MtaB